MQIILSGVPIHYERMGDHGPPVLLLHGWGCSVKHMRPVAEALCASHSVYFLDFPAHGESGRPPKPWCVDDFAGMTREFIGEMGIAPCDIVAHSFGARVAICLASGTPALVRRMVFTGGAGVRRELTEAEKKREQRVARAHAAADAVRRVPGLSAWVSRAEDAFRRRAGSADYNALDEEMRKTFVRVVNEDLTPRLKDIQASTLLVWGDRDTETPLYMARVMEREIPDAGLCLLEGGDHFAYLHMLPRFIAILNEFLKERAS